MKKKQKTKTSKAVLNMLESFHLKCSFCEAEYPYSKRGMHLCTKKTPKSKEEEKEAKSFKSGQSLEENCEESNSELKRKAEDFALKYYEKNKEN